MENKIENLITKREENLKLLKNNSKEIKSAVEIITNAIKNKNKIFFCGNGGSASDSNHLACEFISKFKKIRPSIPAISLSANNSILTAVANDFSFNDIFTKQLEGLAKKGDILIALSTSGKSQNILNAIEYSNKKSLKTILLTGQSKSPSTPTLEINTPSLKTEQIQELHLTIGHIITELCEEEL